MSAEAPDALPAEGSETRFEFSITGDDMQLFARLSGDDSLIHTDDDFARAHGFEKRIVYGGLLLAQLSKCLGTRLPGAHGVSMGWTVTYARAVYVGEALAFAARVDQSSQATGSIVLSFRITALADASLRAKGTAESMVLTQRQG